MSHPSDDDATRAIPLGGAAPDEDAAGSGEAPAGPAGSGPATTAPADGRDPGAAPLDGRDPGTAPLDDPNATRRIPLRERGAAARDAGTSDNPDPKTDPASDPVSDPEATADGHTRIIDPAGDTGRARTYDATWEDPGATRVLGRQGAAAGPAADETAYLDAPTYPPARYDDLGDRDAAPVHEPVYTEHEAADGSGRRPMLIVLGVLVALALAAVLWFATRPDDQPAAPAETPAPTATEPAQEDPTFDSGDEPEQTQAPEPISEPTTAPEPTEDGGIPLPTELPDGLPTELPDWVPTEIPTDLPTLPESIPTEVPEGFVDDLRRTLDDLLDSIFGDEPATP